MALVHGRRDVRGWWAGLDNAWGREKKIGLRETTMRSGQIADVDELVTVLVEQPEVVKE
jgi:hypothetical protein